MIPGLLNGRAEFFSNSGLFQLLPPPKPTPPEGENEVYVEVLSWGSSLQSTPTQPMVSALLF